MKTRVKMNLFWKRVIGFIFILIPSFAIALFFLGYLVNLLKTDVLTANALVAVSTIFVTVFAGIALLYSKDSQESLNNPDVSLNFTIVKIDSKTENDYLGIEIKNYGQGYAKNIKVSVTPEFETKEDSKYNIMKTSLFSGISRLSSNESKIFVLDKIDQIVNREYSFIIEFENCLKEMNKNSIVLNLNDFNYLFHDSNNSLRSSTDSGNAS